MLPDPTRADAAITLIGEWTSTDPTAELDRLAAEPLPEGCLAAACYRGVDGVSLLHYSQWSTSAAARAHAATAPIPLAEYRRYRSQVDATGPAGCVVIAAIDSPIPDARWQRDFVDGMFEAGEQAEAEGVVIPGLLAAHFHLSADGTGVRNYAEWTDVAAHQAFTGTGHSPAWKRYLPHHARTL
ncbi:MULTISPECIES: antibiotic biosynthesis monooxygenase [unclassified Crossiella]|uniref:antibiotic biosynthesis monooxygenase n=1 Tax=unclassified Crossiella TaxID=2620835 RepID=UPI001FFE7A29|nr:MULTISPECIES: antibiotic biosynthesis monooxygenase [unclassified Crossiella]MCK2238813.1 antibiotic biosynthesis monooxygenase [Crossiella sp. S99.2]MCK2251617.1 antibiotic biosynthesis monooxygenase [Crossiella sp. S99.1]